MEVESLIVANIIYPVTFRNVTGFVEKNNSPAVPGRTAAKDGKTADPQNQSDTGANIRNRGRFRNDPGCVLKPVITYELKRMTCKYTKRRAFRNALP